MARTSTEIKASITTDFISRPEIIAKYDLIPGQTFEQQLSVASFESILFDTIANDMAIHEQLVETNALNSRVPTTAWYKATAESFLDGLPLVWINNQYDYDLTSVTDAASRKIITRCAVLPANGTIVMKVATDVAGVTQALNSGQLLRFENYIQLKQEAGDVIVFINEDGDNLKLSLTVQVDVSQIDLTTGKLLSVTGDVYPVKDAIKNYLANLSFNGALIRTFLMDAIQEAVGVKNLRFDVLQSKFGGFSFVDIGDGKIPHAGWFKLDDADLTINYIGNELSNY